MPQPEKWSHEAIVAFVKYATEAYAETESCGEFGVGLLARVLDVNQIPLKDGEDALLVNWCELTITRDDGTLIYKNNFATNHQITEINVEAIVSAGRTRWKVENKNNNTLKTKGYNLEHNFGH